MVTESPGPKSLSHFKELAAVQECSSVHFFCDYSSSYGNYVVDADGNRLLDVFSQIGELLHPLQYPSTTFQNALTLHDVNNAQPHFPSVTITLQLLPLYLPLRPA